MAANLYGEIEPDTQVDWRELVPGLLIVGLGRSRPGRAVAAAVGQVG